MKVEECLQELSDLLEESWNLPLIKGKAFIDVDRIKEILHLINDSLPGEFVQAKAIVADRAQIINDAKIEAENIVKSAKNKAEAILSKDELVKQAETMSERILSEAKNKAKNIKRTANEYVDSLIKKTDKMLTNNISEFRNACHDIRSSFNN